MSVSAESKGLICTKIVQKTGGLGTAHSKGLIPKKDGGGKKRCHAAGHGFIWMKI
jgi:hypothetical protein